METKRINNTIEISNKIVYEKVLSTNNGDIVFYPQVNLFFKKPTIVNPLITYKEDKNMELNHKIKLRQKQITTALKQSYYDDKLMEARLFERNCNNLLDVIENMDKAKVNINSFSKRENVVA